MLRNGQNVNLKLKLNGFFAVCFLPLIFSCTSSEHLYDRPGFDPGTIPKEATNDGLSKIAPDYYYHQPAPYQPQPYYSPQTPQAYAPPQVAYQPQPQYYYPPQNYQPQGQQGGSRFYSNPYAIPPATQYPNYDADQYYVPPAYVNNIEPFTQSPQPKQQNFAPAP